MRVYQEGQRSACDDDAVCPYGGGDWRVGTWNKGKQAAEKYWREVEGIENRIAEQQAERVVDAALAEYDRQQIEQQKRWLAKQRGGKNEQS
jgi:poly(3-hydroxybutyrate) depolymerase